MKVRFEISYKMKDSCKLRCRKLLQPKDAWPGVMETLKYSSEVVPPGHIKQVEPIPPVQLALKLLPFSQKAALMAVILFAGIRKSNGLIGDRSVYDSLC
ncbi:hypothetical protein CEXT_47681 [Caerostris extrusa]|uniref:Uncharacterized protein n=1 Tax=Caerostris extrusa TaxID=172846 RepID=A0AAV4W0Y9_CAEEX|nr:hypothetical protein CEXT_47681 [Caerostris extrusa]